MSRPVNLTRRVFTSAFALAVRTAWERCLTLVSTLVVARLLVPSDLGKAAIVLSITGIAMTLIDAGLTTSLVRQPDEPSHAQLRAATRLQVGLGLSMVVMAAATALVVPQLAPLVVLSSIKLPIRASTLPIRVGLQRILDFRGLAFADGVGQLTQAACAVGLVVVDRGPGALIGGDLAGALANSVVVALWLRRSAPAPHDDGVPVSVRSMVREAAPFQGFSLLVAVRDLATTSFVSLLVGTRDLGLLQFAYRVLSPVFVVFQSVAALAVPVGARALQRDDGARAQVRSGFLVTGTVTAIVLATVAAPAQWAVPVVFGHRWHDAIPAIAAIALALVVAGPVNSIGVGLLVAARRLGVAAAAVAGCTAWFMVSMAVMLPLGGVAAGAFAWVGMAVIESTIVLLACRRILGLSLGRATVLPVGVFAVAYVAGHGAGALVASTNSSGWAVPTVAAAAVAAVVSIGLAAVVALRQFRTLWQAARPPAPVETQIPIGVPA
jgi:O-antigen/teichoic acid export membrane protein